MIARDMRDYVYYLYGESDSYGQLTLIKDNSGEPLPQGTVSLAVYNTSQSIQANINYKDCSYVGLTYNKSINDSYVIQYGEELLKVLYVTPGRVNQVFLKKI